MCGVNDIGPFRGINDFLVDTFYRNYYYFEREFFFFFKGECKKSRNPRPKQSHGRTSL